MAKIDDVAKLAKVSKGTVSNVFSGKRPTSDRVKERVFKAAKQLNYSPNHIARSLATKKTMIIGVKIPYANKRLLSGFHTKFISGAIAEASKKNYRILIDTIFPKDSNIAQISTDPMDGVIVIDPEKNDKRIDFLKQSNTPFVILGEAYSEKEILSVDNNNEEIVYKVTDLLIQKGHKKILFLNAHKNKTVAHDRKKGFFRALKEKKIIYNDKYNIYQEDYFEEQSVYGYKITKEILKEHKETNYTAIITDTDIVAIGVLKALKELRKKVPEDISLVALSDDVVLAYETDPLLTTVNLFPESLGRESVKLLLERIENKGISSKVIIPAKIIERNSCNSIKR